MWLPHTALRRLHDTKYHTVMTQIILIPQPRRLSFKYFSPPLRSAAGFGPSQESRTARHAAGGKKSLVIATGSLSDLEPSMSLGEYFSSQHLSQRASLDIQGIDIFVAAYVSRNRTKGPLFNSMTGKLSQTYHACSGALTSWFARRVIHTSEARLVQYSNCTTTT